MAESAGPLLHRVRLSTLGLVLICASFLSAFLAGWLWFSSALNWQAHLSKNYLAGVALYETMRVGTAMPEGIVLSPLPPRDASLADGGDFGQIESAPKPAFVTTVSFLGNSPDRLSGQELKLGIVSPALRYAVSDLPSTEGQPVALAFGALTRSLATFCSEPLLYAQLGDQPWLEIDGTALWGCEAAPRDYRLFAILLTVVALAALSTWALDTSARFEQFAAALRNRRRLGGPESYSVDGPAELQEIVAAVNMTLEAEREQLRKRVIVLSGVSHDLGTPATRLKLRANLISDPDLRDKFVGDIEQMTDMIESVLTYTRAELAAETPRELSLDSLLAAMVDDYEDMDHPVSLIPMKPRMIEGSGSLFSSKRGQMWVPGPEHVVVTARPVSLKRAIANLIDNALKYGRRASVGLETTYDRVVIIVEDEGSDMSPEDIDAVFAPFERGENVGTVSGFGLGLTIVATVAEQHGGRLWFEQGAHGLRACLDIPRG
ncbi:HAMP domain-containing histidine kinase [Celeribacter sp. ASW11-22]|nr:HAMP domain-containing histidine kinase [Celeribacter litoreus]